MKEIEKMTVEEKYDYLIGMIEGCMEKDSDIVASEQLLDSLIQELKKEAELKTLKNTKFLFMIQTDMNAKTYGYNGLCESIGNLKSKL